jgi:alkylhydroperoxidase family enzyme
VDEAIWQAAREQFSDEELAALLFLVGLIDVWNRITSPSSFRAIKPGELGSP